MRFLVLLFGLAAALGCGERSMPVEPSEEPAAEPVSPVDARKDLAALGITYTERAFLKAVVDGDLVVVKLFVEAGMSVNTDSGFVDRFNGLTALHWAAMRGHLQIVKYLVEQGADVNAKNNEASLTPLHLAAMAMGDQMAVVRYLVEQGADVDARGGEDGQTQTARGLAEELGHTAVVAYLESVGG